MTFGSNVAPPKIPLRPKPEPWTCHCLTADFTGSRVLVCQENPGYLSRCPGCGMRRP